MKKLKNALTTTITSASLLALTQTQLAFAQVTANDQGRVCGPDTGTGNFSFLCNLRLGPLVGGLISFIFVVAGIIALVYLVWGGIKWMISGGDKSNIEAAQGHIVAAIIGLVIIFVAYVVVNLVWSFFFGVTLTGGELILPTLNQNP